MNLRFWQLIAVAVILAAAPAWARGKRIVMAYSEWVPVCYTEGERPSGLLPEIARIVMEEELGLVLEGRSKPWKRAQKEVETGESDFMITAATEARKRWAVASESVFYRLPLHIYTYRGHEKRSAMDAIETASDIKRLNLVPVTNLGNGWHKEQVDAHGIATHYVGKAEHTLFFLANKRADIVIDAVVPTNYLINKLGLNREIEKTASRFSHVDFYLLVSKRSGFSREVTQMNAAFLKPENQARIQSVIRAYETLAPLPD